MPETLVAEPRRLRKGARLAPGYRVVGHLARGEALDVYDAWDEERHCRCVVKLPRPDRAGDERVLQRLRHEGGLLHRLAHPHLVRAYALLEAPTPAVVLETLPGATLEHLIDELPRPLPAAQVALLGAQLGSAVRFLHRQDVLHLDLKPANVVVTGATAKLLDLSLARPPGRVRSGYGTPDSLAPEQARGEAVGPAADVWGLGTVLFEVATGEPAFGEPADGGYEQLTRRAAPVAASRRLPRGLRDAIDGCLEPAPADRPALDELLGVLDAAG